MGTEGRYNALKIILQNIDDTRVQKLYLERRFYLER